MSKSEFTATDSTATTTHRRERCELMDCAEPAAGSVIHPGRGELKVCDHHRREIAVLLNLAPNASGEGSA